MLAASWSLGPAFPRLLALELLAAALWEREELGRLAETLDALDTLSPVTWRSALHHVHLALRTGSDEDVTRWLSVAREAKMPASLLPYVWHLEGLRAAHRGELVSARTLLTRCGAASLAGLTAQDELMLLERDPASLPRPRDAVVWQAPTFVFAREPRFELSIELWRHLGSGRHARFIASRLAEIDPHARWRKQQARELGVSPWRTHEELLGEVLVTPLRRMKHARFGTVVVVREVDGGVKLEVALPDGSRKTLLASVLAEIQADDL